VIVWQVWAQSDMTEGRGGMTPMAGLVFATKQEAWDSINRRGGVMGRKVGVNCWPMDKLTAAGATTWQEYEEVVGMVGDYDVRPSEVADDRVERPLATEEMVEELLEIRDGTADPSSVVAELLAIRDATA
jgi:hypothetical protein